MLKLTNPWLRRSNVVLNSFSSCISNTSEKFPGTPEMPFSKMSPQPRMLLHQTKSTVTFKQLESFANTHGRRQLNKQVDVVNSEVQLINFALVPVSNLPQEKLTIHSQAIKLERVSRIFNFPDKMESILSEAVFPGFQFHFLSPESAQGDKAHANFVFSSEGLGSNPSSFKNPKELNLLEDGNSSLCLKAQVSLP